VAGPRERWLRNQSRPGPQRSQVDDQLLSADRRRHFLVAGRQHQRRVACWQALATAARWRAASRRSSPRRRTVGTWHRTGRWRRYRFSPASRAGRRHGEYDPRRPVRGEASASAAISKAPGHGRRPDGQSLERCRPEYRQRWRPKRPSRCRELSRRPVRIKENQSTSDPRDANDQERSPWVQDFVPAAG
jgi:hypothetical protein